MKTAIKLIAGSVAVALSLAPAVGWTDPQSSALQLLLGAASLGDDGSSAASKAEELLREARRAMDQGRFDAADARISRAEALHPKYPLFHLGDTPKKARADLAKLRAQQSKNAKSHGKNAAQAPRDPFLPQSQSQTNAQASGDLPRATAGLTESGVNPAVISASQPARSEEIPTGTAPETQPNPWNVQPPASIAESTEPSEVVVGARYSQPPAADAPPDAMNQVQPAHGGLADAPAVTIREQGPAAGDASANLVGVHINQDNAPAPTDAAVAESAAGADADRRRLAVETARQARAALAAGDLRAAEEIARQAESLVPDSAFQPGEDRPSLVLLDIEKAKRGAASGATPAGGMAPVAPHQAAVVPALYNPEADESRVSQASAAPTTSELGPLRQAVQDGPAAPPSGNTNPPTPDSGTGEAQRWYRQGIQSVAQGNSNDALTAFRRAYAFEAELDPNTRRQLHDHLRILGEEVEPIADLDPQAGPAPMRIASAPEMESDSDQTLGDSRLSGQALARQVTAEVARQQSLAKEMRQRRPKQALELLEQTRGTVSNLSALDPAARDQLLRRLDLSIGELKQYLAENAPQIELDEKNRQVEEEVDRRRKQKVEVEEKLAYLVNDFNKLIDEQRYAEAQVLAKRASELDPDSLIVTQLLVMSKQLQRVAQQDALLQDKEEGFYAAMYDVDKSSTPFVGPIEFPDVRTWDRLTKSRARLKSEGSMRRSPKEIEIEKRLSTPVSLKFQQRPLSEVIAYLGKIAQVPVYLDPEGLRAEGVASDTPVTIDLSQDISLKSALKLILEPLRLAYVIKDEVLKITSEDMQRGQLYPVTYPVADLVIPIPNFVPDGREGINAALREAYSRMGFGGATGGGFSNSAPLAVLAGGQGGPGSNAKLDPALLAQMNAVGIPIGGGGPPQSGTPQGNPFGPGGLGGGSQADFDSLIELIRSTVGPPTIWDDMGGQGTIEGFETNLSLVIYQTQEKHEEIADLLAQLRRLQDLQVTIEVRFITLNDSFFERIGVDFDFNLANVPQNITQATDVAGAPVPFTFNNPGPSAVIGLAPGGDATPNNNVQFRQGSFADALPPAFPGLGFDPSTAATFGFAILSDIEAFFLIEAAQGDTRTNVLQAPKITLFNGQLATVSDVTQRPFVTQIIPVVGDFAAAQQPVIVVLSEGTSLTVQAVVSNDRRFVRLTVVPFFSNIGDVDTFTFTGSTTTISASSDSKKGDDESSESKDDTSITEGTTVQLPTFSFVAVSTTVNVPDGGTVLLGGVKRLSEGRNEFGVPVLSKLPYINRLFRNVGIGRTTSSLMMMVTPRIIIQEEEEENVTGTAAP